MAAETAGGLVKHSVQFTPTQMAWLKARSRASGGASVAAVIRKLIDDEMAAEQTCEARAS